MQRGKALTFLQKTNKYCLLILTLCTGPLGACDSASGTTGEAGKICEIDLARSNEMSALTSETVSYVGTLSADCQKKTTELSGRAQINVAAQSKVSSPSISLQELKAGQRNLQFDAGSDNFLRGTYERRFDTSFYPDWNLPWSDRPTVVTLSMSLTDETLSSALPSSVRVELLY